MEPIYLDYNATTPIEAGVAEAMIPFLKGNFGNPSSGHIYGQRARKAVDKARDQVAGMLGCKAAEIVFTSGGTESNNLAIKGIASMRRDRGNHIITSSIEHPAVSEVCRYLEAQDFDITVLPVNEFGMVAPEEVEKAISPGTILITIMHANNEVGTVELIERIAAIARKHGILLHTDCAQSVGKIPVTAAGLGADMISIAGHKIYGPKGIGALYIREGIELEKQIHGAGQESGLRPGTENVLEIVGLGQACELISENLATYRKHMAEMRDRLEKTIKTRFPDARINGHPDDRLPNTLSVSFKNLKGDEILRRLTGVAASAGAACHSGGVNISHVLKAMKVPEEYAIGTLRLSVGRHTTADDIDRAAAEIVRIVGGMK